ncbi:DNA-binding CsgD family transcriptional regulator [Microbacterium phyllosphaerae]|uniref:DNA-binding CsgD family transcriptional regulator n=1 Tax=Microbacterium phyllosphaerae TaxID=124798 RepID=A0ABS4WQG2_9MICO|nr:LuxR C-terminal-related transcriptional regulator [Microbacterium phyllosphaerae]MBP2378391.1 DNA-binding CsgD family transcriptional regulator [Microbacterium phyllosphaerae]
MSANEAVPEVDSPALRRAHQDGARAISELADRHAVALESLLAILRSDRLDDRAARNLAIESAANALVQLRVASDRQKEAVLEPVVGAFARLQSDLRPLERFGNLDVQFIEPPATGRALPSEVAHAARAIVRNSVLAIVDDTTARRVRIQWDCDGLNLLIGIRDDGRGELSVSDDALRPAAESVVALNGDLAVSSTEGWGSAIDIRLPLDPPAAPEPLTEVTELSAREREVLRLVVAGSRNREIASTLGISDNTVKFHVSNLLRKTGCRTRGELASLAR